ncbi:MAG: hypothetical protein P4N59_06745 [Negativicutes bacterium]|nr:hypothetical protein [Negativicutes bacterium]
MKKATFMLSFVFLALFLLATTSIGMAQSEYTVMTANTPTLGQYLVDGQGNTLYYFTKDMPGVSVTKGQVAVNWPSFNAGKIIVPAGLDATDFGVITREDGKMQTTYKGWPLYYFSKDMSAGDIKGQKINDVWFVVTVN